MHLLLGAAMTFLSNLFNIMEIQELAENRDNYKSYQAFLVSSFFGLTLALFVGLFVGFKICFIWPIALHSLIWIAQVLASFTLATKMHPITFRIMAGLRLPIIIIFDILFGNISFNIMIIVGLFLIMSSVYLKMKKENAFISKEQDNKKIFLIMAISLLGNSIVKVLKYQIRTKYDVGVIDFLITNTLIAIPLYLLFLISIKEFKPKSIIKNKLSHMRAGIFSAIQQLIGLYVLGYITATISEILKSLTSYIAVPISRKSKDEKIKQTGEKSYMFFAINTVGTILVVLFK